MSFSGKLPQKSMDFRPLLFSRENVHNSQNILLREKMMVSADSAEQDLPIFIPKNHQMTI